MALAHIVKLPPTTPEDEGRQIYVARTGTPATGDPASGIKVQPSGSEIMTGMNTGGNNITLYKGDEVIFTVIPGGGGWAATYELRGGQGMNRIGRNIADRVGFFGIQPVTQPTQLSAPYNSGVVDGTWDIHEQEIMNSLVTRVGEIEDKLVLLGLLQAGV